MREAFPKHLFYCPHEHESIYQLSYAELDSDAAKELLGDKIIEQCVQILLLCDLMVIDSDIKSSRGVQMELLAAQINEIPYVSIFDTSIEDIDRLI